MSNETNLGKINPEVVFPRSLEIRLAQKSPVIVLVGKDQMSAVVQNLIDDHGQTLFDHIGSEDIGFDTRTIVNLLQKELETADQAKGIVIPIEMGDAEHGRKWLHLMEELAVWSLGTQKGVVFVIEKTRYDHEFTGAKDKLHSMESPLEEVPQPENPYSFFYTAAWQAVLDPSAKKPDYSEQLATVHRKLPEMGKLVYRNLNQLIRDLGGEGNDVRDKLRYQTVSRGIEDALNAYTMTTGDLESRARSMTTALGRAINFYPAHIANIFDGYTPVFGATNEDEVVIKEANIKGFALMQEWMIGLALKRREEGSEPFPEARLRQEVEKMMLAQSSSSRYH